MSATIPDAEKARRYRRKLSDLLEKIEAWGKDATRETAEAMLDEARIVRTQLEVEDRLTRRDDSEGVYARPECVFHYCPSPEGCKSLDRCQNALL